MKRLLIPLLAALALPTAVNGEEFIELNPKPFSYLKSSLVKYEKEGTRFIEFNGTTQYKICLSQGAQGNLCLPRCNRIWYKRLSNPSSKRLVWQYELDCTNGTFNRKEDNLNWNVLYVDQTAISMAEKYCPKDQWSKLPNK
mgnify:CR=1 FL=1